MSKKKITDPTASMEELIQRAVQLAEAPFTPDRKPELPSLRSVAEQLGTTVIRTRKLLTCPPILVPVSELVEI